MHSGGVDSHSKETIAQRAAPSRAAATSAYPLGASASVSPSMAARPARRRRACDDEIAWIVSTPTSSAEADDTK